MLTPTSRDALREALVGVTTPRTEALILMGALSDEDLLEIIQVMRRIIGFDGTDIH